MFCNLCGGCRCGCRKDADPPRRDGFDGIFSDRDGFYGGFDGFGFDRDFDGRDFDFFRRGDYGRRRFR